MVLAGLVDSDHHGNKWCCVAETPYELYGSKIHSVLDKNQPHFVLYGKIPRIHEQRKFGCDI